MKPSNKFNHRRKFERELNKPKANAIASNVEFTTGAVDEDFEDFGEKMDYVAAPGLLVHHYFGDDGVPVAIIEKVRPAVD